MDLLILCIGYKIILSHFADGIYLYYHIGCTYWITKHRYGKCPDQIQPSVDDICDITTLSSINGSKY